MSLLDIDERTEITIGDEYIYENGNLSDYSILKDWDEKHWDTEYKPTEFIPNLSLPELHLLPNIICNKVVAEDMKVTYSIYDKWKSLHIWISQYDHRYNCWITRGFYNYKRK